MSFPSVLFQKATKVCNGFLQSDVLGEVSVLEGGSSGRSFSRSLPRSFPRSFRPCFAGTFRAIKNFSKNFSPKFPWPCTAKLEKFQGKNFMTRFCRGTLANTKDHFDMTALIFSTGGCPSGRFYALKRAWCLALVANVGIPPGLAEESKPSPAQKVKKESAGESPRGSPRVLTDPPKTSQKRVSGVKKQVIFDSQSLRETCF